MPDIQVSEYERGFIDYTLTYGQQYSVVAKRGTPVLQSDVTHVYFYVKATLSDTSPFISLSDASSSQIEWLDATAGKIRVKLGTNTGTHAGDSQPYELRLKMADGSYISAETGLLYIKNSVVDNP